MDLLPDLTPLVVATLNLAAALITRATARRPSNGQDDKGDGAG
ncbi:hypothetical protein AB0J35_28105 [Nonomuraea angiospora]